MKTDSIATPLSARYQAFLADEKQRIIKEWLRRRRNADRAESRARREDRFWLDHLPEILAEIISALGDECPSPNEQPLRAHDRQPLRQGFSADASAFDLQLLGSILRERLESFTHAEAGIDAVALLRLSARISEVLDGMVGESVAAFQRIRDEQNQLREAVLKRRIGSLSTELSGTLEAVEGSFHDLRGSTDILARLTDVVRRKVGDQADSLLAALAQGLRYNQAILADLEALSRDPAMVQPASVNVAEFVHRVWDRVAFCGRVGQETVVEWEASRDFAVELDPVALERILANLMENAIVHGKPGGPVRIGWWAEGKESWRFEIENPLPAGAADAAETEVAATWLEDPVFAAESTGLKVIRNLLREMNGKLRFCRPSAGRVRARINLASPVGQSIRMS